MCTLVILHGVVDAYPLVVAANRDEAYDRSATGVGLLQASPFAVLAPKDEERGGTWFGAAQGGWFVAITNQDVEHEVDAPLSRGHVITELLTLNDHRRTVRRLLSLERQRYNPFNVVFGRPGAVFLARVHHDRPVELDIVDNGITIVTNDTVGPTYQRKANHAAAMANMVDADDCADDVVAKLRLVLGDHTNDEHGPHQAMCVHDVMHSCGTRSSTILLVSAAGDVDYYHHDGPPCNELGPMKHDRLMSLDLEDL